MIRLTEAVTAEVQKRDCPPLENFLFTMRLQMWPAFQKVMSEHCDALKKLAEGGTASYFSKAASTTDASVSNVCLLNATCGANFKACRFARDTLLSSTPLSS